MINYFAELGISVLAPGEVRFGKWTSDGMAIEIKISPVCSANRPIIHFTAELPQKSSLESIAVFSQKKADFFLSTSTYTANI